MLKTPFDLAGKRILLSNDDGVDAPGLKALEKIARAVSKDVWVVAPESEQSAMSHSLTIRRPLRVRRLNRKRFAVDGTPTDCVLMAVNTIMRDRPPDLMLSGVNRGANLAEDVIYSGTVAAAMEGAMLGLPSIAFSQARPRGREAIWDTALHFGPDIVRRLVAVDWPADMLVNVNFPYLPPQDVTGVEVLAQGQRKVGLAVDERPDPYGLPYYWIVDYCSDAPRRRRTDLAAIERGAIAITPLRLDLTHRAALKRFGAAFA